MMTRQIELPANIGVALVADRVARTRRLEAETRGVAGELWASGRKTVRRFHFTTGLGVKTRRAVTRFAAGIDCVRTACDQTRVVSRLEIAINLFVALFAFLRANVAGARNFRKRDHGAMHRLASDHSEQQNERGNCECDSAFPF
jgi:hypothetical protein